MSPRFRLTTSHPDLYLQTYNLTISKQFWSNVIDISYVGVKGTHQDTSLLNYNTGLPQSASADVNADRPFPTFGQHPHARLPWGVGL